MELQKRKPNRLSGFDYSTSGYYFITICTAEKQKIFGTVVGRPLAAAEIKLTNIGKIVEGQLYDLEKRYANVRIDKCV